MTKYAVSIRERDDVAKARGEFMGLTFWANTIEAANPAAARVVAERSFLEPLDCSTLDAANRPWGEKMEQGMQDKRQAFRDGQCEITCRVSKAKG